MRRNRHKVSYSVGLLWLVGVLGIVQAQPVTIQANTEPGDAFGHAVALAPPYLLIAAPGHNESHGAVYVFRQTTDGWVQAARLTPPNPPIAITFGFHIALDGQTIAIGEPRHPRPFHGSGAVYIYEGNAAGVWVLRKTLMPPHPGIARNFGAVHLNGDTLLVGATGADGTVERQGVVYLYARHHGGSNAWGLVTTLLAPDGAFGDRFGGAVKQDGSTTLIGASSHDTESPNTGAVFHFTRKADVPDQWNVKTKLRASDGTQDDAFGDQIVMHEDLVLVGAPNAEGRSPKAGAAYLFARDPENRVAWLQVAKITASDGAPGDRFGYALAMDENLIMIGAPGHDGLGKDTGALYVFARQSEASTTWKQIVKLTMPSGSDDDAFAQTLTLRDDLLVVGAPGAFSKTGAAYLYDLSKALATELLSFHRLAHSDQGLPNSSVEAILQDREGFLWFGTYDELHRYDGYTSKRYRHDPDDTTSLSPGAILALLEDRKGHYWIGTEDGLNRFDHQKEHFIRYKLAADSTYPRQSIRVLFEDRDGTVWTGTNGRLYRYDGTRDRFETYAPFTGLPERLDERYVSGIQQDRNGHLWVLSKNLWENRASLYQIDLTRDQVTRYTLAPEWGQVGPFLIDSRDNFWIKARAPIAFPPDAQGVLHPRETPVSAIHWTFYEDPNGVVWTGTAEGLYRSDPAEAAPTFHRILPSGSSNFIQSIYQDRSGRLLAGTHNGVYQTNTNPTHPRAATPYRPPVVLTGIQVSNRDGTTQRIPYNLDRLTLSYRDYSFAFEYAALTFASPQQHRYRYRIQGFDKDWIDAGTRRFATYSNVPPGRYTLQVDVIQAEGAPDVEHLALPLIITPAFWQTWWFRGLVVLLAAVLLAAAYRYRVQRLLEMERMRLRIAGDLHDDVSSNLSGIALMSQIVEQQPGLAPEHRHQLARIADTAQQTVEDLRNIVWLVNPGHDHLDDLLLKMKDTAATLLDGTAYTFKVADEADPGPLDMEFRRQVFLIYKEVLHNIARHARAASVQIEVRQRQKTFILQVTDDGVGFDPAAVHRGHGLHNLHRRAETLGAHLEIASQPGTGTQITLAVKMA
ncbi:MAG: two-component regulator propeller domain-containing protein [Rhodothermales bacterium]